MFCSCRTTPLPTRHLPIKSKLIKNKYFLAQKLSGVFIMLINVKMSIIVGILTVISRISFILVEHEKSFITMRPDYSGACIHVKQNILLITEPLRIHKTSHKVGVFPSFILHIRLLIESNTDFCFAFQKTDAWCSLWPVSTWLNSLWNMFLKGYPFGSKEWTKELKLECAYFLGQTR